MRRVLRRRELVVDDWRHWEEDAAVATPGAGVIVPLTRATRQSARMVCARAERSVCASLLPTSSRT